GSPASWPSPSPKKRKPSKGSESLKNNGLTPADQVAPRPPPHGRNRAPRPRAAASRFASHAPVASTAASRAALLPSQSPQRAYSVTTSVVYTVATRTAGSNSGVRSYVRPSGSTNIEIPVLAARATPTRCSIARITRCAGCCHSAVVRPYHVARPYHASLVMLTR